MAMDIIDRLHEAVKSSGINRKTIARRVGMSESQLSRFLRHLVKKPSIHDVEAILEAIGRSMESLFASDREIDVRQALRALTEYVDRHETKKPPAARSVAPKRPRTRTAQPFLAAANGVLVEEGRKLLRTRIPNDLWRRNARFAARVVGDSMIDAGIDDGDTVFFRENTTNRPPRGKIIVCRVNTSVYVKRLEIEDGERRLASENVVYSPLVLQPDDEVELYGIVVLPAR
ncbi:MAG: helix-turn-helix domain-containing protein [Acidobacteriota bacterium]|nr:helix-turn-helix domain-containing protein [Acidobacteriota bacterium]